MKKLAFSKKFIFTLFAVLIGVNLWGQEPKTDPINLEECTIYGVNEYYNYSGSNITINYSVKHGNTSIYPSDYYSSYSCNGISVGAVNGKGLYTLTINGDGTNTTGTISADFFVIRTLSGDGSVGNPYLINDEADWVEFAKKPEYSVSEKQVRLNSNITVGAVDGEGNITRNGVMVGENDPFCGVFNGGGHNLTYYYNCGTYYAAPFYWTDGATIKNLKIDGKLESYGGYVAGLIYSTTDENGITQVERVTVSAIISSNGSYCAGFAVYSSYLAFDQCIYNGIIEAGSNSGGFSASFDEWGNPQNASFNECVFDPSTGSTISDGYYFAEKIGNCTNCYYTVLENLISEGQGMLAYQSVPSDDFVKKVTVNNTITETTIYKHIEVSVGNVEDIYVFKGSAYDVNPTATFDDLGIESSDYTISILKDGVLSSVLEIGDYEVKVSGYGVNASCVYGGAFSKGFKVVNDLTGSGTSNNPYIISSADDWLVFAFNVKNGNTYFEKYLKLTNDITISTMVGTEDYHFSGHFTGQIGNTDNIKTLTFNYGTSGAPTEEEIVAPFRYTDGATITYLKVNGKIYTNVGKEAGLIGVNNRTSDNTKVTRVIVEVEFNCLEDLWDAEGGGFAYIGNGIEFNSCAYRGKIHAFNYMGGFCGNADVYTTFKYCLFNPAAGGSYWAENFVYNKTGSTPSTYYNTCYYTLGNNQEDSEQGTLVYVGEVPPGTIGKKLTELYGVLIYTPVEVVISNVNDIYIYDENTTYTITPIVKFNGTTVTNNNEYTYSILPSTVHEVGDYTLTVTGRTVDDDNIYVGSVTKTFYVVNGTSDDWKALQALLNGSEATISLTKDITAGANDLALSIPANRTVIIYLNGHTIDRGKSGNSATAVTNGQVLRIAANATVIIEGGNGGTIRGGYNIAANNNENANNDGGGISNLGNLTLNNVIVRDNKCIKTGTNTSRTARGGGIYSGKGSTLTINGGEITNNRAEGGGGGIFVYQARNFTINKYNSSIQPNVHGNTSKDKGGGIRVDATNSTTATINDGLINSNTVEYLSTLSVSNGGGLHLDAGNLTLENCVIDGNRASKYGGGIYIMGGQLHANNCSINNNMSYDETSRFDGCGGGICLLGGKCYLNGGTISGNSSSVIDGGGIYVNSGTLLSIQGDVDITENWKFVSSSGSGKKTTNVYLVKSDGKIKIEGSIAGSTIGVSKKGNTGVFTDGLSGHGTIGNFSSDNSVYSIVLFDNEAKLAKIDPVTPPETGTWNINEPVILNTTVAQTVNSIVIENNGCLYVNTGGYINGVSINNNTTNAENKLVINGGQVIPSNPGVPATVKKDIKEAYVQSHGNWYLISSPLVVPTGENPVVYNSISILDRTNLIVLNANHFPEYDLYRFNEGATVTNTSGYELQWENYRAHSTGVGANFTTLEKGRGYLYRNYNDYTITMTGAINIEASIDYTLSYHSTVTNDHDITHDNLFKGFNIIGNPYTHNISKGITGAAIPNTYLEAKYYVLDQEDGSWDLTNDGTAIPPVAGILVQAKSANTLTITNSTTVGGSKGATNNNIWFTVANSKYDDRACVEFRNGRGLNKIAHPNENVPMLYIRHNDEDFASVDMNPEAKQFDLYFEAATLGQYTLTVNPQGNYSYLHLIDKVAEEDIDLLKENEYSFIGSPSDNADRFVVRLNNSESSDNSVFAYQSGNDIVVCGEGELSVFDVMGRLVAQKRVNGVESIDKPQTTGVYIIKLNDKTQKIVID